MASDLENGSPRDSGIDAVGLLPWGTHLCQFYDSDDDLIGLLTAYFRAGLAAGEYCLWITSSTVGEDRIRAAMRAVVPDLDRFIASGAFEVVSCEDWYRIGVAVDCERLLAALQARLEQALARGFDGLRAHGNESWLTERNWRDFLDYEARLAALMDGKRMLVLCTYPMQARRAADVFDVAAVHEIALARRSGRLDVLETPHARVARTELLRLKNEGEELHRLLADNASDAITLYEENGNLVYASPSAERTFGVWPLGVPTAGILEKIHEDDRAAMVDIWYRWLQGEQRTLRFRLGEPDGSWRWFHAVGSRVVYRGKPHVMSVARDVTDNQRAYELLRASELRFRELAQTVEDVFWIVDVDRGVIEYASPAYERVWGRTLEELYSNRWSWLDGVHPDDRDRVSAAQARQADEGYDEEYRVVRPDGSVRWIRDHAYPVREGSRPRRVLGVARDITEHRELGDQLRQSQKLEAIGLLAGGVAHDFNNMLSVIMMHTEPAPDSSDAVPADVRESLGEIRQAAESAANLTRQLLLFSRRQVMQPRELDVNERVAIIGKMLQRIIGEDVTLEIQPHARALPARADPGMLDQVLLNLAVNARDAMPHGGRLTLATSELWLDDVTARHHADATSGAYARISVTDTGTGIPADVLPRIFDPFFTTKEPGRGTGLGLATVYGIVRQHRGFVQVETELGHGTTFHAHFPLAASAAAPDRVSPVREAGGTGTIVLVEDDRALRAVTRRVLEQHGYVVLEAGTGHEAIEQLSRHRGRIDLVLTDLVMPEGMSGHQVAERVRALDPDVAILFTSGYSTETAGRELAVGEHFLGKPFSPAQVLAAVRRCLEDAKR